MPKKGEVVMLKSGGPGMMISYVLLDGEGSREKAAALKGFNPGDVVCEWQHQINEDNIKNMRESFKAAMLMYTNGKPLPVGGGSDNDDDDDDW
jgi:uncharacterized protein YodC (DUF2158 family)